MRENEVVGCEQYRCLLTQRYRSCTLSLVCVGVPPVTDVDDREAGRVGGAVTMVTTSGNTYTMTITGVYEIITKLTWSVCSQSMVQLSLTEVVHG